MQGILLFLRRHGFILGLVVLFLICTLLYFYLKRLPETNDAFVVAKIRPVSSQVDGFVDKIYVSNNQYVKKGQLLYTLNTDVFQLALDQAKVNLEKGQEQLNSLQTQLQRDQQLTDEKLLSFQTAQYNFNNATELYAKNAVPKAQLDNLNRMMGIALADYNAAKLQFKITNDALLQVATNNKFLSIAIKQAQLQLSYTKVSALSDGIVSNLNLAVGTYVKAGQPLFAFIDTTTWWVQANIQETELTDVKVGDIANIKLRLYPKHNFTGVIEHIGWAVQRQQTDTQSFLATVASENQWFLLPQRFPVMVRITNATDPRYPLHVGASATVRIKTASK